jgi:ADP-ribose pyrophosphatase YjhB (NUDIX family)
MKPISHAVAFVLRREGPAGIEVLAVLRRDDDPHLPSVWGLPAATVRAGETEADAVRRAARDKLGVEVSVGEPLARGETERPDHVLRMTLYAATVTRGDPHAPQPGGPSDQYAASQWSPPSLLDAARRKGSLCCRLFLETSVLM